METAYSTMGASHEAVSLIQDYYIFRSIFASWFSASAAVPAPKPSTGFTDQPWDATQIATVLEGMETLIKRLALQLVQGSFR